ncbi:MAG: sugar transferase [Planctomycetota bacterium]
MLFDKPFVTKLVGAVTDPAPGADYDKLVRQVELTCRLLGESIGHLTVALPVSVADAADQLEHRLPSTNWLWYSATTPSKFAWASRDVWLINGAQSFRVDWPFAKMLADRRKGDWIMYAEALRDQGHAYHDSVEIDDDGKVLRFHRHYTDSTTEPKIASPDPWLFAGDRRSAAVMIRQLGTGGWNAESVDALAQRYSIETADNSPRLMAPDFMKSTRNGKTRRVFSGRIGKRRSENPERSQGIPDEKGHDKAMSWRYRFAKRTGDIVLSSLALIVASPLLLAVAVAVKVTSKGPVFFGHKRQGLNGREFRCLKFRTMIADADEMQATLRKNNEVDGPQFKIANDPRLTKIGDWLRKTNIDEVPQFFNVLVGHMSLVGPRPSPDGENQFCPGWRRTRLSVRPGVTGLWQVMRLRNATSTDFQEWIYYDLEYVRKQSFWLDLQILWHTPISMIASRRIVRFARRLRDRGICTHSAQLQIDEVREMEKRGPLPKAG